MTNSLQNDNLKSLFFNEDFKSIFKLIEEYGPNHIKDKNGDTPLHLACGYGYNRIVDFIMISEVDVNSCNNDKRTPLHEAAYIGNTTIIKKLLKFGANISAVDHAGNTPLHLASKSGNASAIQLLINNGADIYAQNKKADIPLHYCYNLDGLQVYVKHNINLHSTTYYGDTILHFACRLNNINMAQFLLKNNMDIYFKNDNKESPLYLACKQDNQDLMNILISHNLTSLLVASLDESLDTIKTILLQPGFYLPENIYITALELSTNHQNFEIANTLKTYKEYQELNQSTPITNSSCSIKKNKL